MCVSGKPCSRSTGGPAPPCLTKMSPWRLSTTCDVKLENVVLRLDAIASRRGVRRLLAPLQECLKISLLHRSLLQYTLPKRYGNCAGGTTEWPLQRELADHLIRSASGRSRACIKCSRLPGIVFTGRTDPVSLRPPRYGTRRQSRESRTVSLHQIPDTAIVASAAMNKVSRARFDVVNLWRSDDLGFDVARGDLVPLGKIARPYPLAGYRIAIGKRDSSSRGIGERCQPWPRASNRYRSLRLRAHRVHGATAESDVSGAAPLECREIPAPAIRPGFVTAKAAHLTLNRTRQEPLVDSGFLHGTEDSVYAPHCRPSRPTMGRVETSLFTNQRHSSRRPCGRSRRCSRAH